MVARHKRHKGDDSFSQVGCSIDTGRPVKEGYTRGELVLDLLMCEPVAGDATRTHVQYVSLVDPKGSVPSMIVNQVLKNRTAFFEKFRAKVTALP